MKAEGGQSVFQSREERDSSELGGSSGGYGFSARIPLKDIAPGLYVLRVEAQSRVGDRPIGVARDGRQRAAIAHDLRGSRAVNLSHLLHQPHLPPRTGRTCCRTCRTAPAPAHRTAPAAPRGTSEPHRTCRTRAHLPHPLR